MDFAGFEVLGRVAEGSTGVVWQARQVALGRLVAIKELAPSLLAAPGFLERFRAEARVLGGLDDPHVVRLYDYVEEPQRAYLVQEWVDGAPLSAVLDRHGRLSAEQSLGVIRGGLLGLAHAHQRGLVHRDVSMANILVDAAGVSKLVDFGLAAPSGSADGLGGSSVGTPAFSSPEAVLGQPMTPRSDVYSAAAVLFALLTARAPYVGDLPTVLQAHVTAPTPALPGFAPRLTNLLWRAMAKRPEDRPADAAAFLAELEEAAREAYGAAWLGRASVAGLATAGAVATGSVAAFGGAAAQTAAQAVSYGAATTPAILAGQVPAAAVGISRRVLGLPRVALMVASTVVVAAVAVTAFAVTRDSGDPQTASAERNQSPSAGTDGGTAGETDAAPTSTGDPTTTAPTTTPPPAVPAFHGTYDVVVTVASIEGVVYDPQAIGTVTNRTWEATASCTSGPCDTSVSSSSGLTFAFVYSGGGWTWQAPSTVQCVDLATGVPNGQEVSSTVVTILTPTAPIDPTGTTPIAGFTGTTVETVPAPSCGEGALVYTSTVEATLADG